MLTNGYSNYPMILPLWHTMTIPCVFGASTASDHAKRLGEVLVLKDAAELAADHQIHPMQLNLQAEVEFHLAKLIEVWAFFPRKPRANHAKLSGTCGSMCLIFYGNFMEKS